MSPTPYRVGLGYFHVVDSIYRKLPPIHNGQFDYQKKEHVDVIYSLKPKAQLS